MTTTFDDLFAMPSTKVQAQVNPPVFTSGPTLPSLTAGVMPVKAKATAKTLRNGSGFRTFINPQSLHDLRSDLKTIYENRNDGTKYINGVRLVDKLDQKSHIKGQEIINGSWRDFIEGLESLGKLNGKDFTNKHLSEIERLWLHLGNVPLTFPGN